MKAAIIGMGNIGTRVVKNLAGGTTGFLVADRELEKAQAVAVTLDGKATAVSVDEAVKKADILILTVWFDVTKELLTTYRDQLAGKIVVDPSNPIAPDGKGGFAKTIPEPQSSGQILSGLLTPGARFVKAFGTLSAETLSASARKSPPAVLFYATDDAAAGDEVARLIIASGYVPMKVGGVDQSIRLEVFGDLHEFGKLGHSVTLGEAKALLANPAA